MRRRRALSGIGGLGGASVASISALALMLTLGSWRGLAGGGGIGVGAERGADWSPVAVPGFWEDVEDGRYANYDGIAWYRAGVIIPAQFQRAGDPVVFAFGPVAHGYEAYLNGTLIGKAGEVPARPDAEPTEARRFEVDPELVRWGRMNHVAVRVSNPRGKGGFLEPAPFVTGNQKAIELKGLWQFRTGDDPEWAREEAPPGVGEYFHVMDAALIDPRAADVNSMTKPLEPRESFAKLRVADDLEASLALSDPLIAQPLQMSFDERGRLWLVEYRQYPHPAGLKLLSRDKFWRARYDRVPEPPPIGPRGKDRISIHEDTNGDGTFDKHTVFVDGLNIATSCARGRGGVFVLNPPYLLFYVDRDGDDAPDGDPEVLLEGFGMEDSHSVTNSLRWGPDGWLYATQGSTVSGAVRRPGTNDEPIRSMGQLVWRYHPETRRFEIFAEGGGNAFGLEIDAEGRVFSGHNGGDTRGFHYMQGAYLQKGFSKHGGLSNPYAFGYFPPMEHHSVPRFTHTFLIYDGIGLPEGYRNRLLGAEPLQGQVVLSEIERDRSTFRTRDLSRPARSEDRWFRPVDVKQGPGGALYVADWYDKVVDHYLNHEGQVDPERGRVYRLTAKGWTPPALEDLSKLSTVELVSRLDDPDKWTRQTVLRLLGDRRDPAAIEPARAMLRGRTDQAALEGLWALNLSGGLDEESALEALGHERPAVRAWTARLVCDDGKATPRLASRLAELAATEPDVETRAQLASSARRLPAELALPIARNLTRRDEDAEDPRMPLLVWWLIESKTGEALDATLELFRDRELTAGAMTRAHLAERMARRLARSGTRRELTALASLLDEATERDAELAKLYLKGFEEGFAGRSATELPAELGAALERAGGGSLELRLWRGQAAAVAEGIALATDRNAPQSRRLSVIGALGRTAPPEARDAMLDLATRDPDDRVRVEALAGLGRFEGAAVAEAILRARGGMSPELRATADQVLTSRREWAEALLNAIEAGEVDPETVSTEAVRTLTAHRIEGVAERVRRFRPDLEGATTEEMKEKLERLGRVLRSGRGEPYAGKRLFLKSCANCHALFEQGGNAGPDLTSYNRDDIDSMLLNVINPSAQIREGYETVAAMTTDGRVVTGFLADQDDRTVVLRGVDGRDEILSREDVEELVPQSKSLMPEGLLDGLTDQEARDLFAYLRSSQPLND